MSKLTVLPHQAIIDGLKGKVDFYLWKGIPVARKWPRSPGRKRAAAVEAQWEKFTYAASEWNNLSVYVKDHYITMASGTGLSGRDLFTRSYLTGLYPTHSY